MADVLIAGGGLAGSLVAWRLAACRPDLHVRLLERGTTLGGNHTWSFHETDIGPEALQWMSSLVIARWPSHAVRFPGRVRTLPGAYASISASHLHAVIAQDLGARLITGAQIERLSPRSVTLMSGERLDADVVIDARGDVPVGIPLGWQTFLGQELVCDRPHGVTEPLLMDATVPQDGSYRFIYVLPFSETTLLVEDTRYADGPAVEAEPARRQIAAYAAEKGWPATRLVREEVGSLPLPLGGDIGAFWPDAQPRIGLRAGLFHPTTGYSLPDAVATAERLVHEPLVDADATGATLRAMATERWRQRTFFRLLNRMLFRAAAPDARVRVLEQFYGRPADLIARFYAGRLSWWDQCRLLTGRPPVPMHRALRVLTESSVTA